MTNDEAKALRPGELVQWVGGGPKLRVKSVGGPPMSGGSSKVHCEWFGQDGEFRSRDFSADELVNVSSPV